MGLFDKLTGTQHPPAGLAPLPAEEVRAALLGLNQPDVPYVIRYGAGEQADLVAELRIAEPAWRNFFVQSQLTHAVKIRMRLNRKDHEVRVLEEQREVTRVGNPPSIRIASSYSRGPDRTVTRQWTLGRGDDGRLGATETFRFSASDLRTPLKDTVLNSGWTWRSVIFGRL